MQDTVRRILTARVYDEAEETPLDPLKRLSARIERPALLKREDLQPVFSFKIRGAYNKIAALSQAELARGVICASAGNHAQGVALAAAKRGAAATIVMPTTTPGKARSGWRSCASTPIRSTPSSSPSAAAGWRRGWRPSSASCGPRRG